MNKVIVDFVESDKSKRLAFRDKLSNNASVVSLEKNTRRYEGWVPVDYVGAQLRQDVAHYWQLDPAKYELIDGVGHVVVSDGTRLDTLTATSFSLRKQKMSQALGSLGSDLSELQHQQQSIASKNDPFWLQEKLFDIFLLHVLPHWNGKVAPVMSCYQFKQLIIHATAAATAATPLAPRNLTHAVHVKKHELTVRVLLAFKSATPNYNGAGARFDAFLDALVDVAAYLFPRICSSESKEQALEQLALQFLIPYYDALELETVHHTLPSWSALDELVHRRPKVTALVQRFTQPLFAIALAYSTSIAGPRHSRGLQFHELARLIHDVKPSCVPFNTLELCFCFIHCCRIEHAQGLSTMKDGVMASSSGISSLASLFASTNGSGRGVLEVPCSHIADAIAYAALLSVPRLALARTSRGGGADNKRGLRPPAVLPRSHFSSKLAVQSIKAFLHFISLRLATTGRTSVVVAAASMRFAGMKKDTTLPLVSATFMQELAKMHREDALTDYVSTCSEILERVDLVDSPLQQQQQQQPSNDTETIEKDDATPEQDDEREVKHEDESDADLGLEINWDDDDERLSATSGSQGSPNEDEQEEEEDQDDEACSLPRVAVALTLEEVAYQQQRERDEIQEYLNDADEIYAFLANELHRQAIEGKLNDSATVPQMLDIWVAAGQKYAQVLQHLDALQLPETQSLNSDTVGVLLDRKVCVLERFGASLYVFAMQLLKSTTKVFQYEELFLVTNARVYSHVSAELWDDLDGSAAFTTDLAMETLSLACGKLSSASTLLEQQLQQRLALGKPIDEEQGDDQDIASDVDGSQSDEEAVAMAPTASRLNERYMQCLLHRANCLNVYGDVLAHNKRCIIDFELGCTLEDDHEAYQVTANDGSDPSAGGHYYGSSMALSKTSRPGQFYREAKRIYLFLLAHCSRQDCSSSGGWTSILHDRIATVQFKLATHLPRGCLAEKRLLDDMVHHLSSVQRLSDSSLSSSSGQINAKKDYVSAVRVLRSKFFQPETEKSSFEDHEGDAIVPFYRFVLAAAIREIDPGKTGILTQKRLTHLNEICGRSAVADHVMMWLVQNFDHHDSHDDNHGHGQDGSSPTGLTEKGLFQYFCWLAEADPLTFCETLDLLTAKHTETPVSITSSITTQTGREPRAKSLRTSLFDQGRQRSSDSLASSATTTATRHSTGFADCVVVVGARMTTQICGDISLTVSPSEVKLEPVVVDILPLGADVPEELSKFCFPDDPFMSSEPLPPKSFDIVLTDITGTRLYGSCFQFSEEKDPIDILAMLSGIQRGTKTASLPSWISLKDIQQRKATTKYFIPKCICILSSVPLFQTFRDCLTRLFRLSISMAPFPIESFVFTFVEQVQMPTTGNALVAFSLIDRIKLLSGLPPATPVLYPSEVDFTLLFQCLSAENILKVYGYLLTEKKVVLCSQNGSILTPVAETFRGLLFPFDVQVVYIPVLPLALLDFVTAPVPFFMGVRSDQSMDLLTSEGVVVVYLDRDEVAEPTTEIFPVLPEVRAKKLLQALRKTSAWATSQHTKPQFGRYPHGELCEITSFPTLEASDNDVVQLLQQQEDLQEKWTELYVLFTTFTMRLLKDFRKYCHHSTSPDGRESATFDKKAFLAMHPSQREFCSHLFHTQLFQRFIESSASLSETVLQLAASDAEHSWRHVRAKTNMIRRAAESNISSSSSNSSESENGKSLPRQITRVPPPQRLVTGSTPTHRRRASGRHANSDVFGPFHGHIYEELRGLHSRTSTNTDSGPQPLNIPRQSLPPTAKFTRSMTSPRGSLPVAHGAQTIASHGLVGAARLRLDTPIESGE